MKLNKLIRDSKYVQTIIEKPNDEGHMENFNVTAHEAPHPEMDTALENLAPICARLMEFKSVAGLSVSGVCVSYTKHGTRSASFIYSRSLGATGKTHKGSTVYFRIDDPAQDEDGERQMSKAEADAITAAINEGFRYARGERQQILLPLDKANGAAEPVDGEPQDTDGTLFDGEEKNPQPL